MMSMSAPDTTDPAKGLRTWSDQDDEPGADVLGVVDTEYMFWEHRDGKDPWWCGYGVTWELLRSRGPLREVGSYAPLDSSDVGFYVPLGPTPGTPEDTPGLRTWFGQDDEPGADVPGVVSDTCMLWEHRDGKYPWWCGYGVTWGWLRRFGPLREVGSYAPLDPADTGGDAKESPRKAATMNTNSILIPPEDTTCSCEQVTGVQERRTVDDPMCPVHGHHDSDCELPAPWCMCEERALLRHYLSEAYTPEGVDTVMTSPLRDHAARTVNDVLRDGSSEDIGRLMGWAESLRGQVAT